MRSMKSLKEISLGLRKSQGLMGLRNMGLAVDNSWMKT